MNDIEYCENCGNFVEVSKYLFTNIVFCPECDNIMRGGEGEDQDYGKRIKDGFEMLDTGKFDRFFKED